MSFDPALLDLGYVVSAVLFIVGLKNLGHPRTAPRGNRIGALAMLIAVLTTLAVMQSRGDGIIGWPLILGGMGLGTAIGLLMAYRVKMTQVPEMVALLNGFGGAASALVALSEVVGRVQRNDLPEGLALWVAWLAIGLSALVGWATLTGSLVAMFKLMGGITLFGRWIRTPTWGPTQ